MEKSNRFPKEVRERAVRTSPVLLLASCLISCLAPACGGGGGNDAGSDGGPDGGLEAHMDADAGCGVERSSEYAEIPMRDGKMLHAFIDRAKASGCALPTVLVQTPYGIENVRKLWFGDTRSREPLFGSPHYSFVMVDWRGFFGSKPATIAIPKRAEDGFDTVEWVAAQPWSDGKVGGWGASALCGQQFQTASLRPPHFLAAVPIFCSMNQSYGQFYTGGVLRKEYNDFLASYYGGGMNPWKMHPTRDAFWVYLEGLLNARDMAVPMLVVSGFWDLHNPGSHAVFRALRSDSDAAVREKHRLLIGSWSHFASGGETEAGGRDLSEAERAFMDPERRIQRDSLDFFDLHLRGRASDAAAWAPVRHAQPGEGGWASAEAWPPPSTSRAFFLDASGALSDAPPSAVTIELPFDPMDPSPTIGGPTLLPTFLHGPADQAKVTERADARVFTSSPLAAALRVRGVVTVDLEVSTPAADTDFAVRLTDVGPDGVHLAFAEGMRRLKMRGSYASAEPVEAGKRYMISIPMVNEVGYTLAAGHRLGLIVTSSNYALFDRNPNTGDHYFGPGVSPKAVINSIHLGASKVNLPVVP